jgi:hypothetical protein
MKNEKLIAVSIAVLFTTGCSITGTSKNEVLEPDTHVIRQIKKESIVPKWYLDYPTDTTAKVFASATAKSDDMQFSMDKALHDAKVIVGDKLSTTVGAEFKHYIADNGAGDLGTSVQESEHVSKSGFTNVNVSGYVVENKAVFRESNHYRSYVLISLDKGNREEPVAIINNNFTKEDHSKAQSAFDNLK